MKADGAAIEEVMVRISPVPVEEGLVNAKDEPYLLRERSADGVVRYRGESEEEGHSSNHEDKSPKLNIVSLSLIVSQSTAQNMVCKVLFVSH